jgi:glycosyltransferase involved in cell wall biosynthesis
MKVQLVMHGNEAKYGGGPSTRVPRLCAELIKAGIDAETCVLDDAHESLAARSADIVHVFNSWPPKSALHALLSARATGARLVFSPIALNLSAFRIWNNQIPRLFADRLDTEHLEEQVTALGLQVQALQATGLSSGDQSVYPRYVTDLKIMFSLVDRIVTLSTHERHLIASIASPGIGTSLVSNPVDPFLSSGAGARAFTERCGVTDYLLTIGRIEPRKNQLLLAYALRATKIPLVFLGAPSDPEYASLIRKISPSRVVWTGRVDRQSELFRSALEGARAFVMPSWTEGAPLSALEAGVTGMPLVLSRSSSEQSYFRDHATYVNPHDLNEIRMSVLKSWENASHGAARIARRSFVEESYSWERHVRGTIDAYHQALASPASSNDFWSALTGTFEDLDRLQARNDQLEAELMSHQRSRSWRLTAPLRWLNSRYRRWFER